MDYRIRYGNDHIFLETRNGIGWTRHTSYIADEITQYLIFYSADLFDEKRDAMVRLMLENRDTIHEVNEQYNFPTIMETSFIELARVIFAERRKKAKKLMAIHNFFMNRTNTKEIVWWYIYSSFIVISLKDGINYKYADICYNKTKNGKFELICGIIYKEEENGLRVELYNTKMTRHDYIKS